MPYLQRGANARKVAETTVWHSRFAGRAAVRFSGFAEGKERGQRDGEDRKSVV